MDLALDLLQNGLYSCGTLRSNRKGFPTELKKHLRKGLDNRGDSKVVQAVQADNLTVSLWQDNRPVVVIATNSDPTSTTTLQRKKKAGSTAEYSCPNSIADYNDYMGGVDANDQLRGYYKVRSICKKQYKYNQSNSAALLLLPSRQS